MNRRSLWSLPRLAPLAFVFLCFLNADAALAQCGGPFRLVAPDAAANDLFGSAVAVSGDTAIVGAHGDDGPAGVNQGSAYIYRWDGAAWAFEAQLTASDAAPLDLFGISVALSGNTALVGASSDDGLAGADQGSAYVFTRSGTSWTQQAKLTASDAAAFDGLGIAVALSGNTAVIGAAVDDGAGGVDQGSAYVFVRSGSTWSQQAKLTASDAAQGDNFGSGVAVSGDWAIIGAGADDGPAGINQGSAYVFTRSGADWTEHAKLTASDAAANDLFGISVALSGNTALVGASSDDGLAGADQGSAYVFTRSGTSWTQQAKLTASDAAAGDSFGCSVAVSGDFAIVGARLDDGAAGSDQGSAHIFKRSGSTWAHAATLTSAESGPGGFFGCGVALSGDTAVVGANGDNGAAGVRQGSAHVFHRSGATWAQSPGRLTSSDAQTSDLFGFSISLSGDTAIIGAPMHDAAIGGDEGAAFVLIRSGAAWTKQAKLTASDGAIDDQFGTSVAISGDTALIGAPCANGAAGMDQGAAYVFTRTGSLWTQQARLTASDAAPGDSFGWSVTLEGDTAIIGAPLDNGAAGENQGSAYVFVRSGTTWSEQAHLFASDAVPNDSFGGSVALSGNSVVVGAPQADGYSGYDQGSAYIFTGSGAAWNQQAALFRYDATPGEHFGQCVALFGDTAVVGAPLHYGFAGPDQGSAYVFRRSGDYWNLENQFSPLNAAAYDHFGTSVAVSEDRVVVGAPFDAGPAGPAQGSVEVFTRSNTTWTRQTTLTAPDALQYQGFGFRVALSGDTAIVGIQDSLAAGSAESIAYSEFVGTECASVVWDISYPYYSYPYQSLALAITSVGSGGHLLAEAGALNTPGPIDLQGKSLRITSRRGFLRPWYAPITIPGGASLAAAQGERMDLYGDISIPMSASATLDASVLRIGPECLLLAQRGSTLTLAADVATLEGNTQLFPETTLIATASLCIPGRIDTQSESTVVCGGPLDLSGPAVALSSSFFTGPFTIGGAMSVIDATFSAPSLTVGSLGVFTVSGDIFAPVTNQSRIYTLGNTQIVGGLTNNTGAVFAVQIGVTTLIGSLVNNGTIVGVIQNPAALSLPPEESSGPGDPLDEQTLLAQARSAGTQPGDGLFIQGDYAAGAASSLALPGSVWRFSLAGDYDVAINSNAQYDMRSAELRFTGGSAPQTLEAMSADFGATLDGLDRAMVGHYPLGTLRIGPGSTTVTVVDTHDNDNAGQASCEAVYAETLILESGATLNTPSCRVYYVNLINNGGTITTPASVIAIPTFCPGDADGSGMVNFADVLSVLGNFGANYTPNTGLGDADGNGIVNFNDVISVLANFNAVCP